MGAAALPSAKRGDSLVRRRVLLLVVALVSALVPVLTVGVGSGSADPTTSWGTWMGQAFDAIESSSGATVVPLGDDSAVDRFELQIVGGPSVSVEQRTVLVADGTTDVLVGVTVLGGQQLVVDLIDPTTGDATTLVLAPDSSNANQRVQVHARRHLLVSSGTAVSGDAPAAVAGGCYASPDNPFVIGSVYGPLVKGIGVVSCPYGNEKLAVTASLYERTATGSTHVGNGGTGSVFGTYLAVDAYDACSASTGHQFQTAQLWSVNGVLEAGATSGWPTLGCK
jgi:hypothetical protein